ncbi:MAG: lysophospholipid acyltransferase family protein [Nitrospinae bacterium]|nr:lysophospholipid acyltransferase family protein [Nitrospinota bacterium]
MEHPWWMSLLPAGAVLTRLLGRSLRCAFINYETEQRLRRTGEPILAVWHGQLFFFVYYYRDQAIPVMMSHSADGEILARLVNSLGFFPVRGSSSRGGMAAFREVVRLLKEGRGTGFAPDGPRGPRCLVQPGIIELARASGRPILPASFAARRRVVFNSWDRFVVPLPFSRAVVIYGEPLEVRPDDDGEAARLALEEQLIAITRRAEATWSR